MDTPRWQRNDNWIGSAIEDSFVMVNIETGKYIALNQTANTIWAALEEPRTSAEIVTLVQAEYEVPAADCEAAVDRSLSEMQRLSVAAPV